MGSGHGLYLPEHRQIIEGNIGVSLYVIEYDKSYYQSAPGTSHIFLIHKNDSMVIS